MNMDQAITCLAAGGVLVYPTETFYALGCRADMPEAITLVYQLKGRPAKRPLALAAGSVAQVRALIRLEEIPESLWQRFWPGPLSILARARSKKPDQRLAPQGFCAVRVPGNAMARQLAADCALTSSSANTSGRPPVTALQQLEPALLDALENCGAPWGLLPAPEGTPPAGGLPSTLVRPIRHEGGWRLEILREGAVSREALKEAMGSAG